MLSASLSINAKVSSGLGMLACLSPKPGVSEGTRRVKTAGTRLKISVTLTGRSVVGRAGARLLADRADATSLIDTSEMRCDCCGSAIAGMVRAGSQSI